MCSIDDFVLLKDVESKHGISREKIYLLVSQGKLKLDYFDGSMPGVCKPALTALITPIRHHKRGGSKRKK